MTNYLFCYYSHVPELLRYKNEYGHFLPGDYAFGYYHDYGTWFAEPGSWVERYPDAMPTDPRERAHRAYVEGFNGLDHATYAMALVRVVVPEGLWDLRRSDDTAERSKWYAFTSDLIDVRNFFGDDVKVLRQNELSAHFRATEKSRRLRVAAADAAQNEVVREVPEVAAWRRELLNIGTGL